MIARADVIGFDIYPSVLVPPRVRAGLPGAAGDGRAQPAGSRRSSGSRRARWATARARRPALRAAAEHGPRRGLAAIAGVHDGIGYFPGHFRDDIAREVKRTNIQIAALAPVLLVAARALTIDPNEPAQGRRRSYDSASWAIVVTRR